MHEMGIANSILEAVTKETARLGGVRPVKVGVRIGELAAVDPEALQFCFEALVKETDLDGLGLDVEYCPRKHRCSECESEFTVVEYALDCPKCGASRTEFVSGDQLELAYLEVAEHESLADGR